MRKPFKYFAIMETKFTHNGITLLFYKKENDVKYSFKIENDEDLTQKILQTVSTKRVNEKAIFYAKEAIFKLINTNKLKTKDYGTIKSKL